jgi:hypothetical protein
MLFAKCDLLDSVRQSQTLTVRQVCGTKRHE